MSDKKNETKAVKKNKSFDFDKEIKGLDIDKNEYSEIVLSNSAFPDRDYFKPDSGEKPFVSPGR